MRNRNHTDGENIQCFAFGCVREVLDENGQSTVRFLPSCPTLNCILRSLAVLFQVRDDDQQ